MPSLPAPPRLWNKRTVALFLVISVCLVPMIVPVLASLSVAKPAGVADFEQEVLTGLHVSGCSIASSASDVLLNLLAVLSVAILGWRYTLRNRMRKSSKERYQT